MFYFSFIRSRVMIVWLWDTSAVISVVGVEGYVDAKIFTIISFSDEERCCLFTHNRVRNQ